MIRLDASPAAVATGLFLISICSFVASVSYRKRPAKSKILRKSIDPLEQVKTTCQSICASATSVFIVPAALSRLADKFAASDLDTLVNGVSWDQYQWVRILLLQILKISFCLYLFQKY